MWESEVSCGCFAFGKRGDGGPFISRRWMGEIGGDAFRGGDAEGGGVSQNFELKINHVFSVLKGNE